MILPFLLLLGLATGQQQTTVGQTQPGVPPPQRQPARDKTATDNTGTAAVTGRITNTEGRPLRRVQVSITGDSLDAPRTASTNAQGRYEVRDLPSGRFTLTATRAGYLRTQYGEIQPGEPGRPVEVFDGTVVDNIDVVLPHTGVITGTVFDEAGDPDAGVTVVPMQMRFLNGKRRLMPLTTAISDDIGDFRLSGLPPGSYYLEAISREQWETDPPEKKMMGFLPTFYPSSPSVGEAQRVTLKLGQQVTGVNVGLIPGKLVTISGTAVNAQGMPLAGESVSASTVLQGETFSSYSSGSGTKVGPNGAFTLHNVSPGVYTLSLRTQPRTGAPESAQTSIAATMDVDGIQLVTGAASAVSGRIVLDGDSTLPADFPLTRMTVRAQLADDGGHVNMMGFMPTAGKVQEDGSFTVENVAGQTRFTVAPLPVGWAIKRVDYDGNDILASGTDPHGQRMDGLLITLTEQFPTINGTLRDDKGNVVATAAAIIFPDDPSQWDSALNTVRIGRVDQTGMFSLRAIRPGSYLAAAVADANGTEWRDPDFLESLRAQATHFMVGEGDTKQLDLIVKAPPR